LYLDQNDFGLFSSPDLKKWERLSTVTNPGTSECPEFFEIPLDGNANDTRWIFYGGTGNYLVGRFDGRTFTPEFGPHRLNDGNCFYASQTFNGVPDGRRIQIAWGTVGMPGMPFNQMMDFPVELTLRTTADGPRLFANPVREIAMLHGEGKSWRDLTVRPGDNPLAGLAGELWHVKAELRPGEGTTCGLSLRGVAVTYDAKAGTLTCRDRSVKLQPVGGVVKLELLQDRTSLEIWANDGERYLPMGVIPPAESQGLELFSRDGATVVKALEVWAMRGIWDGG
ncbi:MAG: GH32 C-terminal domain-containing protein, partial [Armatimonadetes bacterium]|nr:GH32 C-terminal domain-containing protein [Armatimonadota bacterium]